MNIVIASGFNEAIHAEINPLTLLDCHPSIKPFEGRNDHIHV